MLGGFKLCITKGKKEIVSKSQPALFRGYIFPVVYYQR